MCLEPVVYNFVCMTTDCIKNLLVELKLLIWWSAKKTNFGVSILVRLYLTLKSILKLYFIFVLFITRLHIIRTRL